MNYKYSNQKTKTNLEETTKIKMTIKMTSFLQLPNFTSFRKIGTELQDALFSV